MVGSKTMVEEMFWVFFWCVCEVAQSCLTLIPWTAACQAPLSMEFSRQEYWSGLPFLSPGKPS